MNGRFFLDTNIFVYSFDAKNTAKAHKARQLIREGVATSKGIVSYQVVQEFFNVALKRFEKPLTAAEARNTTARNLGASAAAFEQGRGQRSA